jgi:hypothetical protein
VKVQVAFCLNDSCLANWLQPVRPYTVRIVILIYLTIYKTSVHKPFYDFLWVYKQDMENVKQALSKTNWKLEVIPPNAL